jgi:hypothetical protein
MVHILGDVFWLVPLSRQDPESVKCLFHRVIEEAMRMRMGLLVIVALAGFAPGFSYWSQNVGHDNPISVSVIELIATPEKLDGRLISVHGFLHFQREKHTVIAAFLYLHEEDAKHLLVSNVVPIVPNEQMLRDEEKLQDMYVIVTGMFRAVKVSGEESIKTGSIDHIRTCAVWSNPKRPIGLNKTEHGR